MSNDRVYARVEEDLARGHTYVAIQRLSTLVQRDPADLSARSRIAAVHLATGNLVQAGRWSFLEETPDMAALSAFEHAYPHPRARIEAVRWVAGTAGPGPIAAARLATVHEAAVNQPRSPSGRLLVRQEGYRRSWSSIAGVYLAMAVGAALAASLVVGAITILRFVF